MDTRQQGDFSELLVLTELARRGKRVAIPYGNSQGFDLLVLTSKGWKTLQVKTARYRRRVRQDRIQVDTIRGSSSFKNRGYEEGSFDYLVAVLPKTNQFWVLPFDEMRGRRSLSLFPERPAQWVLLD